MIAIEICHSKSGQIVARTANGVRQTYEYDKKGQLLAVKDVDGNAVERYCYDKAGNMLKKKILRSGRARSPSAPQSDDYINTTFTFDAANQLVSSTTDGVTMRYAYDAAGRLVKEGSKTYTYGYLDKVLSVADGDTTRTYTYHADGQLATANYVDNGMAGAHPALSPLRGSLRSGDMRTPQSETFLWDGLALIQRGDEQFVNEPHVGGGNPVASSKGTSYFNDALGTTVGSKSNGKYSAAALTAFGEDLTVHSPTPTQNSNFFTGKPYVEGLGHAFLMRNYRAGLAKWQTADPMGYPDGWNQLAYCNNGVTSAVDLWGCVTEHNISFGWYWEWGDMAGNSHSVAVNPFAPAFAPFPSGGKTITRILWNEVAGLIASYAVGDMSCLTPFWDVFNAIENINLDREARTIAEQKAAELFDDIISVEVTNCEVLKVDELKMDVVPTANGDVHYLDIQYIKVLCLVHIKVVTE